MTGMPVGTLPWRDRLSGKEWKRRGLSAMERKSGRRLKESSGQVPGISGYPARCFCVWKFAKD